MAAFEGSPKLLFTENETNTARLFGTTTASPYVKDGINDYVVHGEHGRRESRPDRHKGGGALHVSTLTAGESSDTFGCG